MLGENRCLAPMRLPDCRSYSVWGWIRGAGSAYGHRMGALNMSVDAQPQGAAALPRAIAASAAAVDAMLETVLPKPHGPQARVQEAMRYATFAGGKRLRPCRAERSLRGSGASRVRR